MAVKRDSRYPGRWTPADADFPLGGPKNRTTPTSQDGSYFNRDFIADYEAFFQRLMAEGGVTANEAPDTAPTSQFYEALSSLIIPVGFTSYSTLSTQPAGRWIKGNGSELSRTAYADLFAAASASSNYVSQALKDADPEAYAGYYGDGDGSTTFTLPDLRGEFIRTWDDGRGVDAGRGFGSFQGDAIRNISGSFDGFLNVQTASGAFHTSNFQPNNTPQPDAASGYHGAGFNASRVVPTADENRPRNVAYTAWIRY